MKNYTTNQEILLNIHTSFCKRDYCEKDEKANAKKLSQKEVIKTLCWDGLLPELLPEISMRVDNKQITLWELFETENSLHLKLGEYQEKMEAEHSLNPYLLAESLSLN